ncbi:hypothetical protein ACFQZC_02680 [Streptacidiphilus monticola]
MSLLFEQVRRGELDEAEALRLHERLTEIKMRLLGDRVSRRTAWRIARDLGWDTLGDAEYLAVTRLKPTHWSRSTRPWPPGRRASFPWHRWTR